MSLVVDDWKAKLADPAVRFTLGRRERDRHQDTPRVAVIPVGGPFASPDSVGRQDLDADDIDAGATRTLYDRTQKTIVECWGEDFDQAEQLMHLLVPAIRLSALGSFQIVSHEWISEQEGIAGDDIRGACVALEVEMVFPVTDVTKALAAPYFAFPCTVKWNPTVYGAGWQYNSGRRYGPGEAVCCD